MRYFICKIEKNQLIIIKEYLYEEFLQRELPKYMKKEKNNIMVIPMPDVIIGAKLFKSDGSYYGTIVYETNTLWGISDENKNGEMADAFSKDRFDEWILKNNHIVVDYKAFQSIEQFTIYKEEIAEKYRLMIKDIDYVNAEQISFL